MLGVLGEGVRSAVYGYERERERKDLFCFDLYAETLLVLFFLLINPVNSYSESS